MKKILLLCLFSILSIFSFANDWEFGSEGEHIIPLKGSAVAIKKEKITLKLTEDGMLVNVKFTFNSPNAENKIIGFVTPESGNNEEYEENYSKTKRKAEPLKIKNFKTTVNGKEVKSNVELLSKLLSRGVLDNNVIKEYVEEEKNFYNYVYYFNANFKQGENVVEHSYYYTGSYGIFERDFAYVVTTIAKWKNKTVEDFEIEVIPGKHFVRLPYTFWKDGKKIDWQISGKGKMVSIAPTNPNGDESYGIDKYGAVYLNLDNGSVKYKTKNFSPDTDFYMVRIDNIPGFDFEFPVKIESGRFLRLSSIKLLISISGTFSKKSVSFICLTFYSSIFSCASFCSLITAHGYIAAVSALKIRFPNVMASKPFCCKNSTSSGAKPPSGPITNVTDCPGESTSVINFDLEYAFS